MEEDDVQLVQVFLCMSQQYDSPDLKRRTLKVPADRTRSLLVEPLGRPSAFSFKSFPLPLPPPPPSSSHPPLSPPPSPPHLSLPFFPSPSPCYFPCLFYLLLIFSLFSV